jgi:hypothetical protein
MRPAAEIREATRLVNADIGHTAAYKIRVVEVGDGGRSSRLEIAKKLDLEILLHRRKHRGRLIHRQF